MYIILKMYKIATNLMMLLKFSGCNTGFNLMMLNFLGYDIHFETILKKS